MGVGILYSSSNERFVATVNYQLQSDGPTNWWGELTLIDYVRISDSEGYTIELEDKRIGKCYLKKRVNRAVSGIPPRYTYRFTGISPLEQQVETKRV